MKRLVSLMLLMVGCSGGTAPPQTTPAAVQTTIVQMSGQGSKSSAPFNAPEQWTITWSFDCGTTVGYFQVAVYDNKGALDVPVQPPDATKAAATDFVYQGGSGLHLEVTAAAACTWTVTGRA